MSEHNGTSERELAEKIIHMHDDLGMGFRRVAKELTSQGWKMNKDRANKLCNKFKTTIDTDGGEDEELRQLRRAETKARQQLGIRKEKEELRKRLTILFVERETLTFERRRKLFIDEKRLLRFAQRVMPVVDPMLWSEFREFVEEESLDLSDALSMALGDQEDFEALSAQNAGKRKLDDYLAQEIRQCLTSWEEECWEECEEEEGTEPRAAAKKEEYATIVFPAPDPM